MDLVASDLGRAMSHDLVDVHVGRGTRAGLVDVEHELIVPLTVCNLSRCLGDGLRDVGVQVPELQVRLRRGLLDEPERFDEAAPEPLTADGEVFYRALGLSAVERLLRHLHLTKGVLLDPVSVSHVSYGPLVPNRPVRRWGSTLRVVAVLLRRQP